MSQPLVERLDEETAIKLKLEMHVWALWLWNDTLVDLIGSENAIKKLSLNIKNAGLTFVLNTIKNYHLEDCSDIEKIRLITDLQEDMMGVTRQLVEQTEDKIVKIGGPGCEWCSGPLEPCRVGHWLNHSAICEAIDPEYTVTFTQMITKGDPICCWVYEKKNKGGGLML